MGDVTVANTIFHIESAVPNTCISLCCERIPLCGAENVSLGVSMELLGFTSSWGFVSIMLYGGGGVSAGKPCFE